MVTPSVAFADIIHRLHTRLLVHILIPLRILNGLTHLRLFTLLFVCHPERSGTSVLPYDPLRFRQLYFMLCCRFPLLCCFFKNVSDVPPTRITSLSLFRLLHSRSHALSITTSSPSCLWYSNNESVHARPKSRTKPKRKII